MSGEIFILFLTGIVAGFLSGFLGIGGGIVTVPVIIYFLEGKVPDENLFLAASTISLAVIIFSAANASLKHIKHKNFYKKALIPIALGSIIGPIPGNYICYVISDKSRIIFFAAVIFLLAIKILWFRNQDESVKANFNFWLMLSAGIVMGMISSMTGLGGGAVLVPMLTVFLHFDIKKAIGISTIVMIFTAASGIIGRAITGISSYLSWDVFVPFFLAITVGTLLSARLGATVNIRSKSKNVKVFAATLYFIVAFKMIYKIL
ncbi:MAG: sulfite exporter TauE/SafE family protein [Candidatus Delongbacteria bacterium]|nr:sulfite exporter TauE/SafE family protein [Candidatus Delongbacteria bacterium]